MANGDGAKGVRYYSSVDSESEEEEGYLAYEPIWRSYWENNRPGIRRTGALWWRTLGLVMGCSAAIALYSNVGDRTNSKYTDMVYNTEAVRDWKEHRLRGEF